MFLLICFRFDVISDMAVVRTDFVRGKKRVLLKFFAIFGFSYLIGAAVLCLTAHRCRQKVKMMLLFTGCIMTSLQCSECTACNIPGMTRNNDVYSFNWQAGIWKIFQHITQYSIPKLRRVLTVDYPFSKIIIVKLSPLRKYP